MIQRDKIFSSFSAYDTDEAYFFYKNVLGLDVEKGDMSVLTIRVNEGMKFIIYPKENHVPATYTVLNIPVTDIDDAVHELAKKGVSFLQYDMPYIKTDSKGITRNNDGSALAWFTDPSENIIALIQE
ncbi:VOC family protein [Fluviicola sp.]|uniref:VOC family protein n=1 Tax=Fluviicola sp. TaxID=1917219 RepID=UPI003D2C14B3